MPWISNDRRSGERRSARLEQSAPRRDEADRALIEMRDRSSDERRRELRRLRQERRRGEIDRGADRAITVRVGAGMRHWSRLRDLRRRASESGGREAMNAVEMDVPEGQDQLQSERGERQATAKPPAPINPTHGAAPRSLERGHRPEAKPTTTWM